MNVVAKIIRKFYEWCYTSVSEKAMRKHPPMVSVTLQSCNPQVLQVLQD